MAFGMESSVTIVVRAWIFLVIFCFASSATGSCLSYGHSCWGAHGKRSGNHNNVYLISSNTMDDMQQGLASIPKEQLMLSRLIHRPLISKKYSGSWGRLLKINKNFPEQLEEDEMKAEIIDDDSLRNRDEMRRNKEIGDMRSVNEDRKKISEILLITNNEHADKPQNSEFYEFLSNANGNYE